jgi:hypothetical protein
MRRKKRVAVLNSGTGPARRPTTLTRPWSPKVSITLGQEFAADVVDG